LSEAQQRALSEYWDAITSPAARAAAQREGEYLQRVGQAYGRWVEAGAEAIAKAEAAKHEAAEREARRWRRRRRAAKRRLAAQRAERETVKQQATDNERKATKRKPAKRQRNQQTDKSLAPDEIKDGKKQLELFVKPQRAQGTRIKKESVITHLVTWFKDKRGRDVSRSALQRDIVWPILGRAPRAH
jgi:hypothetical protein